jgi:dynein heavy chain 1
VLKHARRFHATVSFDSDTHLLKAWETVNDYVVLMKELQTPISHLLRADSLDALYRTLFEIFGNLRKMRKTTYPVSRAIKLVQAVSRDLRDRMQIVLGDRALLDMS